jgi:membrane fusion protein (multidrug efflux system)
MAEEQAAPEAKPANPEPKPATPEAKHGSFNWRWVLAAAPVVLVIGILVWRHYAVLESTDDAQVDGHVTPVAGQISGTVVAVQVADNQQVAAGAELVRLDPRPYQVALDRAKADLAEAEASAEAARTGVPMTATTTHSSVQTAEGDRTTADARVSSARARLREAVAKDTKAAEDLARLTRLVAKDEISPQEHDAVSVAAEAARAGRESAEASLKEAEQGVGSAQARLEQARTAPEQVSIMRARAASAEAKVQQAQAAVAQAELDMEHTRIVAPAAGIVTKKTVEVGQVVQPGQPLLAVVPLDDVWVTANFKENQLRELRPGQSVRINVDAFGGRTYRGRVESVSPATGAKFSLLPAENATGNYVKVVQRVPVKIVFEAGENSDQLLRPGMSVTPTVLLR